MESFEVYDLLGYVGYTMARHGVWTAWQGYGIYTFKILLSHWRISPPNHNPWYKFRIEGSWEVVAAMVSEWSLCGQLVSAWVTHRIQSNSDPSPTGITIHLYRRHRLMIPSPQGGLVSGGWGSVINYTFYQIAILHIRPPSQEVLTIQD